MKLFRSWLASAALSAALIAPAAAQAADDLLRTPVMPCLRIAMEEASALVLVAESPRGSSSGEEWNRGPPQSSRGGYSRGQSSNGRWPSQPQQHDQDEARKALLEGKTKPLTAILAIVEKKVKGPVMSVELETQGSRLVYRIVVLSKDGRKVALDLDASSGEILRNTEH